MRVGVAALQVTYVAVEDATPYGQGAEEKRGTSAVSSILSSTIFDAGRDARKRRVGAQLIKR